LLKHTISIEAKIILTRFSYKIKKDKSISRLVRNDLNFTPGAK